MLVMIPSIQRSSWQTRQIEQARQAPTLGACACRRSLHSG